MAELRCDADKLHDYRIDKEAERRNNSKRIQLNEDLAKWLAKGHEITVLEPPKSVPRQPCKKLMPMPKASKDKTPYFNCKFNKQLREWCRGGVLSRTRALARCINLSPSSITSRKQGKILVLADEYKEFLVHMKKIELHEKLREQNK